MPKEERIFFLSDKVAKNKAVAEMSAELRGLQAGGERRGSDVPQTGDCGWSVDLVPKSPKRNGSFAGANDRKRRREKGQ